MRIRRLFSSLIAFLLILVLFCPALAESKKVHRFKNVEIPFDWKYEGNVFAKGQYDFEIIADRTLNM